MAEEKVEKYFQSAGRPLVLYVTYASYKALKAQSASFPTHVLSTTRMYICVDMWKEYRESPEAAAVVQVPPLKQEGVQQLEQENIRKSQFHLWKNLIVSHTGQQPFGGYVS